MASTSIEFSRMHEREGFEHREFRIGWQSVISDRDGWVAQKLVVVGAAARLRRPVCARSGC